VKPVFKKIRRPLAAAGLCYVAATAAAYFVSPRLSAALAAVAVAGFLCFFLFRFRKDRARELLIPPALAVAFTCLAALVSGLALAKSDAVLGRMGGEDTVYVLSVTDVLERGNALRVIGSVISANGKEVDGVSVLFYIYGEYCLPGDEITCRLSLYPGSYDTDRGVRFNAATPREIQIERGKYKFAASVFRLKTKIEDFFHETMPQREASIAQALVTGERGSMPVSLSRMMQRAGTSHIVVVSGMHITVLLGLLSLLLTPVKSSLIKGITALLAMAALLLFFGFTASVVRACVMGALVFFGKLFYYEHDGATSLSAAAVLILIFSPSAVKNISFQLSFACCLAIVTVFPYLKKRLKISGRRGSYSKTRRFFTKMPETFLLSLTISIVTLPVLILNGIPVSLVSPLTNLLVVPLLSPAMTLSIIAVILGIISKGIFVFPAALAAWCIRLILLISEFFAGFRYALIDVGDAGLRVWALYAVAAVVIYALLSKRNRLWPIALVVILPLAIWLTTDRAAHSGMPEIIFYEGEALVLRDEGETAVIIDRMSENEIAYLVSYLLTKGIDKPGNVVVLRTGSLNEAVLRDAFPHSRIETPERDYMLDSGVSAGRIDADINGSCVIIAVAGRTLAVADAGHFPEEADVALLWRGSSDYEEVSGSYVICFEDVAPKEGFNGRAYRYRDRIRLLVDDDRILVRT